MTDTGQLQRPAGFHHKKNGYTGSAVMEAETAYKVDEKMFDARDAAQSWYIRRYEAQTDPCQNIYCYLSYQ